MELDEYWGKRIKLVDVRNQVWRGFVNGVVSAADNDDTEPYLVIEHPEEGLFTDGAVEIMQSEIKTIEVLSERNNCH